MFEDYSDITKRIAETPKWWDENGVPRYVRDYDDRYELGDQTFRWR